MRERINNKIRAGKLRVISSTGENLGVLNFREALAKAQEEGLDLIEISPNVNPPIAKIMDHGKYQYEQNKKQKIARTKTHRAETKSIQIKIGTGEGDLAMKAKRASNWLKEGHRIKVELFLWGRSKYMDDQFLKTRLQRVLDLITEDYKIAEDYKKGPKGPIITIEKVK